MLVVHLPHDASVGASPLAAHASHEDDRYHLVQYDNRVCSGRYVAMDLRLGKMSHINAREGLVCSSLLEQDTVSVP